MEAVVTFRPVALFAIPAAALLTIWEFGGCVGGGISVGFVLGFAASAFYEPFAGSRVNHLIAAGYGSGLGGWTMLVFCGFLTVFPLD